MPLDPGREPLLHFLICGIAGEVTDAAAFLLGEQMHAPAYLSDIQAYRSCRAPGRVLHQGFLAGEVASIAFLYVQRKEKTDQDQDGDDEQCCVILHRTLATVYGNQETRSSAGTDFSLREYSLAHLKSEYQDTW